MSNPITRGSRARRWVAPLIGALAGVVIVIAWARSSRIRHQTQDGGVSKKPLTSTAPRTTSAPSPGPNKWLSQKEKSPGWGKELEDLKGQFLEMAAKKDLDACSKIAKVMMKQASVREKPSVVRFLNTFYVEYYDKRLFELHAPEEQVVNANEARGFVDQYMREGDAGRRKEVLDLLRKGRLPDEVLPDMVRFIEWALSNKVGSCAEVLSLLNSFVGEGSADALLRFSSPPYSSELRLEAQRLLTKRKLSGDNLNRIQERLATEPDGGLRAEMLQALWGSCDPRFESLLRNAVSDSDDKVRAVAIRILDPTPGKDKETLIYLARSDPSEEVRTSALSRLTPNLGEDEETLGVILQATQSDKSQYVRAFAVRRLYNPSIAARPEVLATLRQIASGDASENVRAEAATTLRMLEQ